MQPTVTAGQEIPTQPLAGRSGHWTSDAIQSATTIIMSLPLALRALVVVGVLSAAVAQQKYLARPVMLDQTPARAIQTGTAPPEGYQNGTPDGSRPGAANNLPQNVEAQHKAEEDLAATNWHFLHQDPTVKELPIGPNADPNNFIHYRYYANDDHCLFIRHKVAGNDYTQWLRNPNFHEHDPDWKARANNGRAAAAPASNPPVAFASLFAVVSASTLEANVPMTPVQSGSCVNPHPGEFKYWWGQPVDQCVSPMYRQFSDGCVHYQLYNRCANSWNSKIFWTSCIQGPHR